MRTFHPLTETAMEVPSKEVVALAITSSTTLSEAKAEYLGNLSYASDGSVAKARLFIDACRALLVLLPSRSAQDRGAEVEMDPSLVAAERRQAEAWIAANDSDSRARCRVLGAENWTR